LVVMKLMGFSPFFRLGSLGVTSRAARVIEGLQA